MDPRDSITERLHRGEEMVDQTHKNIHDKVTHVVSKQIRYHFKKQICIKVMSA